MKFKLIEEKKSNDGNLKNYHYIGAPYLGCKQKDNTGAYYITTVNIGDDKYKFVFTEPENIWTKAVSKEKAVDNFIKRMKDKYKRSEFDLKVNINDVTEESEDTPENIESRTRRAVIDFNEGTKTYYSGFSYKDSLTAEEKMLYNKQK